MSTGDLERTVSDSLEADANPTPASEQPIALTPVLRRSTRGSLAPNETTAEEPMSSPIAPREYASAPLVQTDTEAVIAAVTLPVKSTVRSMIGRTQATLGRLTGVQATPGKPKSPSKPKAATQAKAPKPTAKATGTVTATTTTPAPILASPNPIAGSVSAGKEAAKAQVEHTQLKIRTTKLEDLLIKVLERLAALEKLPRNDSALEAHLKAIENLVGDLYDSSETRAAGEVTRLTALINKLTARIGELENAPDVEADVEAFSPRVLAAEQRVLAVERTLNETREHINSVHAFFTAELTDIRKTISSGPEKRTVSDLHARLDGVEAEFRKTSRVSNIPPPIQATPLAPSPAVYKGTPAISAAAGTTAHAESHRARSKRPAGEADGGPAPKRARQENAAAGPSTLPVADSPIVPLELVSNLPVDTMRALRDTINACLERQKN